MTGPRESVVGMEIEYTSLESGYMMLILRARLDDDQGVRVFGLALKRLDGNDNLYKRVGFFEFYTLQLDDFEPWIAGWTQQTIKLI